MRRRDDPRRGVRRRHRLPGRPNDERDVVADARNESEGSRDDARREDQVARENGGEERLPDKERRDTHHGRHGQKMPPMRLHRAVRPKVAKALKHRTPRLPRPAMFVRRS